MEKQSANNVFRIYNVKKSLWFKKIEKKHHRDSDRWINTNPLLRRNSKYATGFHR